MKDKTLAIIVIMLTMVLALMIIANIYPFKKESTPYKENAIPIADFSYLPKLVMFRDERINFIDNSSDRDGEIVEWRWDFDNDGIIDSTEQNPSYRYTKAGTYIVNLTVVDDDGAVSYCEKEIEVYNLGVLVIAHGFPGRWSRSVISCVSKVSLPVPVEVGFLEYVPWKSIRNAFEKLKEQDVDRIIAIPLFVCGNSTHTPEIYEALEKLETDLQIFCTSSLGDHSLLVDIFIDYGKMLCEDDPRNPFDRKVDPKDATLIFYGHGDPGDYGRNWISLAESIKEEIEKRSVFKEVKYCFMHGKGLRKAVKEAKGHPLVVPWFVARSVFSELPIRIVLRGYLITGRCEYNSKYLVDHPNIPRWIEMQFYNYKNVIMWSNYHVMEGKVLT
ncbi:MAG TPA: PKD domain-containing protein [Thermoplasmatales archaeon]|nr:PKD domain-containing protein [Thermoplasmatales archaeon]